ncbi:hypothetical protein MTO96_007180 [Rhipicephalus appendiculatus]
MWLTKTYISLLLLVTASCHFDKQPSNAHVPVDSFKVIQMVASVPYMAAAYISSPDPEYQCLTASLTSFNETLAEGTYSWYFKSQVDHKTVVKQVNFHVTPGNTSDTLHFTVEGGGSEVYTSYYAYCNYENCLVAKIPYNNDDRKR